ncbi:type I-E CRISPR-associated protein Cas6/Cse3/CasE [Tessaracoccus lubricantis]|uniref:Type I-E CRISPR-associated protein Cas6/Cse3/CasE n=1 Tax=Tessaracoccus lubricantis TaxID=545543 RepID=A0ABP9FFI7_9ACTN
MYLTRIYINARRQGAKKLLGSPQAMHAAVLSGFPPGADSGRALWRVDSDDRLRPALFVVSRDQPDLTHIEEQAGWPSLPTAHSTIYSGFLASLEPTQKWAFRLTANPTHRATINGKSKVMAHVTVAQQVAWLAERQELLGVSFGTETLPSFTLTHREVRQFKRADQTVTLGLASFEGILTVVDPQKLRGALTEGIGRAKAYGCGLMTLANP